MSTRHTQSRCTHCQRTGTITWQSEYICPGTRGNQAALPSVLLTGPQLSPLSALSPHCLSPGGGRNYLLNRQKPPSPLCRSSGLSLLPVPDPLLLCLLSRPPRTYIHTYPRPRPSPIHGFVTILLRLPPLFLLHTLSLPSAARLRPQGSHRPPRCTSRATGHRGGCVTSTRFGWASVAKCTCSSSKWGTKQTH